MPNYQYRSVTLSSNTDKRFVASPLQLRQNASFSPCNSDKRFALLQGIKRSPDSTGSYGHPCKFLSPQPPTRIQACRQRGREVKGWRGWACTPRCWLGGVSFCVFRSPRDRQKILVPCNAVLGTVTSVEKRTTSNAVLRTSPAWRVWQGTVKQRSGRPASAAAAWLRQRSLA